jgi:hypothetical protein
MVFVSTGSMAIWARILTTRCLHTCNTGAIQARITRSRAASSTSSIAKAAIPRM